MRALRGTRFFRKLSAVQPSTQGEMMKTLSEFQDIYRQPLPHLLFQAAQVHRQHHDPSDIQRCVLLSVKTGGCPEDCGYGAQSALDKTGVEAPPLMSLEEVREK